MLITTAALPINQAANAPKDVHEGLEQKLLRKIFNGNENDIIELLDFGEKEGE